MTIRNRIGGSSGEQAFELASDQDRDDHGTTLGSLPVDVIEEGNVDDIGLSTDNDASNDDDDVTVIVLEHADDEDEMVGNGWIDQDSPETRERRRNVLLRELQRVQRASFIHFVILCLIPTSLLFIVIATVLGEDETCESAATHCEKEPRTFISTCHTGKWDSGPECNRFLILTTVF